MRRACPIRKRKKFNLRLGHHQGTRRVRADGNRHRQRAAVAVAVFITCAGDYGKVGVAAYDNRIGTIVIAAVEIQCINTDRCVLPAAAAQLRGTAIPALRARGDLKAVYNKRVSLTKKGFV